MNILVTGGTGFIGKYLVKMLHADKVTVFGTDKRKIIAKRQERDLQYRFVEGDIRSREDLEEAFRGIDMVYHLAACLDESNPELYDINVEGTRSVAEMCRIKRVKKIIFMSSSGVLGETTIPASEKFPYRPKTAYEKSKMESEKIIHKSGVPYIIVRAPIIIGPNRIWYRIFGAARKEYPIIGSGKNHFHLAYIKDVIRLLCMVRYIPVENQTFHIATKDIPTYEEVYRMISHELGVPFAGRHMPVFITKLAAFFHETSCRITGKTPDLAKRRSSIDRLIRERWLNTRKAEKVLKFVPEYNTRMAIRETIREFKRRKML